jgi:ankyrin repeat protein
MCDSKCVNDIQETISKIIAKYTDPSVTSMAEPLRSLSQKAIMEKGAAKYAHKASPECPRMFQAAADGDLKCIQGSIARGALADEEGPDQETALHYAALHNKVDMIKMLLSLGADPNAFDADGNTPLIIAAQLGHMESVKALLNSRRTKVNYYDFDGNHAMNHAGIHGHNQIFYHLARVGSVLNHYNYDRKSTVRLLLEAKNTEVLGNIMRDPVLWSSITEEDISDYKALVGAKTA